VSHGRYVAFQMAEVAIPPANVSGDFVADRRTAAEAAAQCTSKPKAAAPGCELKNPCVCRAKIGTMISGTAPSPRL